LNAGLKTVYLQEKSNNMTLIKSISGIRGTIGGKPGNSLTPPDLVRFSAAYAQFIINQTGKQNPRLVIGRDGRTSGKIVNDIVCGTLTAMGCDVINLGLSTTPTVEMNVPRFKADGGIILTASHNPEEWNALKLLNEKGEFLNAVEGEEVLKLADSELQFANVKNLGNLSEEADALDYHIRKILELPLVNKSNIANAKFKVVVDGINSSGGFAIPQLLNALGVSDVITINEIPNGKFAHNPEPVAENLKEICEVVKAQNADLGIVVDPDVDRLALIDENGNLFGEEYTLVACADYILSKTPGNTASNLSSSRALADITRAYGCEYSASAVGEVNVVKTMKDTRAVIGGEGNGGVIYPALHYGRDALVGVAFILSLLSETGKSLSDIKSGYPEYHMAKNKIQLTPGTDIDAILSKVSNAYKTAEINTVDGVKIDLPEGWIHLRKSNTEPIIRIYTETKSEEKSIMLAKSVIDIIERL
jgi:phosphomannomutase